MVMYKDGATDETAAGGVKPLISHHDGQTPFSATLSVVLMCCVLPAPI